MRLYVHAENPEPRLIQQVVDRLLRGAVVAFPTDTSYVLACCLGDKTAHEKITLIRRLDKKHHFTLMCRDLSEIAQFAKVDNPAFRLLKTNTPGPFTFVLPATGEVPKRLLHPKRKTIGIRVPEAPICQALLTLLGQPLMEVSLLDSSTELNYFDTEAVFDTLDPRIDVFVDSGVLGSGHTTIISLLELEPEVLRQGVGQLS